MEEEKMQNAEATEQNQAPETEEVKDLNPETESQEEPAAEATEDAESTEEAAEEGAQEEGKKGFFSKKNKKDKKDEKIEELTDKLTRQLAEFDNYRKRTEKEKTSMYEIGAKEVVEKILPVVDNFERGLAVAADPEDPFVDGMNKIYKQLMTALEGLGVKPIEAVGQTFDPSFHNAVMHVDDEEVGENEVVEEFQKGYTYRESVVRHSMVKVAN